MDDIKTQLQAISQKNFQGYFDQLKTQWNKCIECQGDYFEEK